MSVRALSGRGRAAFVGITLAGAALRFATLDQQSLNVDEALTAFAVRDGPLTFLDRLPETETAHPLHDLAAAVVVAIAGADEPALRLVSAVAGALTVPAVFVLALQLAGPRAGLLAAALAAVNPALVWYSQEARGYALVSLLATVSLICAMKLRAAPDRRWGAAWITSSVLAVATHPFAVFLVAAETVWVVSARPSQRATRLIAVLGVAVAGGAVAFGATVLPSSAPGITPGLIADTAGDFLSGPTGGPVARLAVLAGLIVAAGLVMALASRNRAAIELAAVLAGAVAVPCLINLSGLDLLVLGRYVIWVLPAGMAVVAAGLASQKYGTLALAVLVAVFAACSLGVVFDPSRQREDWRAAARELTPGSAALVRPVQGFVPLTWYQPGLRRLRPDDRVTEVVLLGLGRDPRPPERPWFLRDLRTGTQKGGDTLEIVRLRVPGGPKRLPRVTGLLFTGRDPND